MTDEENGDPRHDRRRGPFGTALLTAGALVLLLAGFQQLGGLPFEMPRSWYQFRAVWIGLGLAGVVAGMTLLRPPRGDERDTR